MGTVKACIVRPDGIMSYLDVDASLENLQEIVGGYIEGVQGSDFFAYCDEEGKIKNKPVNNVATAVAGFTHDVLCGTVVFLGRYQFRPLHLFGGVGLVLGALGTLLLVYLTVLKLMGEAIGHRPLLTLGVLLVVVGVQLVSLGLVSELVASHHEERTGGRHLEQHVDEILR